MSEEYRFFNQSDFNCKCCGFNNISFSFVSVLDRARGLAGIPFKVISGTRCEKHNKKVGGSPTSSHLIGKAADIEVANSANRYQMVRALLIAGFERIGIGRDFIHVDNDASKVQKVIWHYYK